jgi:hypothetical protein
MSPTTFKFQISPVHELRGLRVITGMYQVEGQPLPVVRLENRVILNEIVAEFVRKPIRHNLGGLGLRQFGKVPPTRTALILPQ